MEHYQLATNLVNTGNGTAGCEVVDANQQQQQQLQLLANQSLLSSQPQQLAFIQNVPSNAVQLQTALQPQVSRSVLILKF